MNHIGSYDGFKVYELSYKENVPVDTKYLYVRDGCIYYGGVRIGRLDANYKVLAYDKEIYYRHKQEEKEKQRKAAVPVPTCVAESTTVGTNGELNGSDEFFARVAKEIDELLKSAADQNYGVEKWNFV